MRRVVKLGLDSFWWAVCVCVVLVGGEPKGGGTQADGTAWQCRRPS